MITVMPKKIYHENIKGGGWRVLPYSTNQITSKVSPTALIWSKDMTSSGFFWYLHIYLFILLWNNILWFPWGVIDLFGLIRDQDKFFFSIKTKPEDLKRSILGSLTKKVFFIYTSNRTQLRAFVKKYPFTFL